MVGPEPMRLIVLRFGRATAEGLRHLGHGRPSLTARRKRWAARMADELEQRGYRTLNDVPDDELAMFVLFTPADGD